MNDKIEDYTSLDCLPQAPWGWRTPLRASWWRAERRWERSQGGEGGRGAAARQTYHFGRFGHVGLPSASSTENTMCQVWFKQDEWIEAFHVIQNMKNNNNESSKQQGFKVPQDKGMELFHLKSLRDSGVLE